MPEIASRTNLIRLGLAFAALGLALYAIKGVHLPEHLQQRPVNVSLMWQFSDLPVGSRFSAQLPVTTPKQHVATSALKYDMELYSSTRRQYGTRLIWTNRTSGPRKVTAGLSMRASDTIKPLPEFEIPAIEGGAPANLSGRDAILKLFADSRAIAKTETVDLAHQHFIIEARKLGLRAELGRGLAVEGIAQLTSWVEIKVGKSWYRFDCSPPPPSGASRRLFLFQRGEAPLWSLTQADGKKLDIDPIFELSTAPTTLPIQYQKLGLSHDIANAFILFPVCALLICILRNVLGMVTFGIFMPMLVAAACHLTGLSVGLPIFFGGLVLAAIMHGTLKRRDTITVARRAAVISFLTILLLCAAAFGLMGKYSPKGVMLFLPVVLLTTTAESLHKLISKNQYRRAAQLTLCSVAAISLCFAVFNWEACANFLLHNPEMLLVVLGSQIMMGAVPPSVQEKVQSAAARAVPWLADTTPSAASINNDIASD